MLEEKEGETVNGEKEKVYQQLFEDYKDFSHLDSRSTKYIFETWKMTKEMHEMTKKMYEKSKEEER